MKNRSVIPFTAAVGGLILWGLMALFRAFPTMPLAASEQAAHVDEPWKALLWVECAIFGLVVAFLAYCLLFFRAKDRTEQGERFEHTRGKFVEMAWLLGSVALTLGLAAVGSHELRELIRSPEADIDVEVRASQFSWEFYYPKYNQYGSKLWMEKGKRHRLILSSKDVVHSFWVPEFRLKQDAVPGKAIPLILTPVKDGEYTILCNQLCGWGHTDMTGLVQVVDHDQFEQEMKPDF